MLPWLPGINSVCFTRRTIAFHLTFAPIKQYAQHTKTTTVLWHEALAGRKGEEITSMYIKALLLGTDYTDIVYFMDNCSGQNKNWSLITAMVKIVNSEHISAKTITFKYLEAGHTFMSADVIHAGVERAMKKKVNLYDLYL